MSSSESSGTLSWDLVKSTFPAWLRGGLGTLRDLVTDPKGFVLGFVVTWFVGGILDFGRMAVDAVTLAFTPLLDAIGITEMSLIAATRPVGEAILGFWRLINETLVDVVGVAGPAAPVVATVVVLVLGYLFWRLLVSVAGEVPVASTIVDFLGLR